MDESLTISGIPRYIIIAEDLRKKIQAGEYSAGSFLPTEMDLQKIYQVSRPTARAAVARLRELGMVEVERGRGTRVKSHHIYQRLDNQLKFTDVIRSQDMDPGTIVLETGFVKATPEVANEMKVKVGTTVYEIGRLRTANDQTISYHLSYLKEEYPITKEALEKTLSLYRCLEEIYDVSIQFTDDTISSERAGSRVARLLGIKAGNPVLVLNRIAYDAKGTIIELAYSFIRSDRLKYKARIYRRGQYQ
jgi:GntR family transcriptional regulator